MKNKTEKYELNIIMILLTVVLIAMHIFFESKSDILGYSAAGVNAINVANVLSNIILPLGLVIALAVKKGFLMITLLAVRGISYCVPLCIFAKENGELSLLTILSVLLSMSYVAIVILYGAGKLSFARTMMIVIVCRIAVMLFSGSIFDLAYGWKNGALYLLANTLYLAASELLFVLPVWGYNKSKKREHN